MAVKYPDGKETVIKVKPMAKEEILKEWYV